jgi:chitinase
MKRLRNALILLSIVAGLIGLAISCATRPAVQLPVRLGRQAEIPAERPSGHVLAGWYAAWSARGRNFTVDQIPLDHLTHVFYAFASLDEAGMMVPGDPELDIGRVFGPEPPGLTYHGHFAQLGLLRAAQPDLRLVVSLGGGLGARFAALAASPEGRQAFIASALAFLDRYGFDGLDLDWEFPGIADRENLRLLVAGLRQALGTRWLSLSVGATAARLGALDLAGMSGDLDAFNLMAYDFHGSWDRQTGHQSALYPDRRDPAVLAGWQAGQYNIRDAIQFCLRSGVPARKLLLGCPAYGRAWIVAAEGEPDGGPAAGSTDGRFRPAGNRKPAGTWQTGTYDWDDLRNPERWPAAERHHDPESAASWFFDPDSGLFVSHDDERSVAAKARFVRSWGLGGMSFWHLGADRTGQLPAAAAGVLRGEGSPTGR